MRHNIERASRTKPHQYLGWDAHGRMFYIMRPNGSYLSWWARTASGSYVSVRADTLGKLADKLSSLCAL